MLINNLLWTEGQSIVLFLVLFGVLGIYWYRPIFYITLFFLGFSLFFFRNPDRVCVQALHDDAVIVCPADGQVIDIQHDPGLGFEGYAQKVSIFLSPFDVHVNWIPTTGVIQDVTYKPGTFSFAFLPKSSLYNEHNDVVIQRDNGKNILVRQIAGMVARRICCWVQKGDQVTAGQKFGMIRFGSRVDILLPAQASLAVGIGQKVYGGYTVLGRWS